MLAVNELSKRILLRSTVSIIFCSLTLFLTGRIGDANIYLKINESSLAGSRTKLAFNIFKVLPTFGSRIIPIIFLIFISTTIVYFLINKFIKKTNIFYFELILYLPCLLIYSISPSKEYLFFIPSIIYIIIECEDLIKDRSNTPIRNTSLRNMIKFSLLIFMIAIRGRLSSPYIIMAITCLIFKNINFSFIKIKKVNLIALISVGFFTSIGVLGLIFLNNRNYIFQTLNQVNINFNATSILTNRYTFTVIDNILNPFTFFKIQYSSFLPSIEQILAKPYILLMVYESLLFFFLFYKLWSKLFSTLENNNLGNLIFSVILINITVSYFLIYGIIGYINIGSSQRFRTNIIPVSLFLPLIAENLINKKKLTQIINNK